jgi:hypothetical protein
MKQVADMLYRNYIELAKEKGTVTVSIDPVIDPVCHLLGITRRKFGKDYLELIQMECLRGHLPYGMMLEVDATWRQQAGWWRRKPENQVWVFDRPVRIIEMGRK